MVPVSKMCRFAAFPLDDLNVFVIMFWFGINPVQNGLFQLDLNHIENHLFVQTPAGRFKETFSPLSTIRSKWCLWSLNQPSISTLQPYWPVSDPVTLSMVRETSPSSSRPSNWYLLGALVSSITTRPSVETSWSLQPDLGIWPRPQHTDSCPWDMMSYLHDRVTFWPVWPTTLLLHSLTVGTKKTLVSSQHWHSAQPVRIYLFSLLFWWVCWGQINLQLFQMFLWEKHLTA